MVAVGIAAVLLLGGGIAVALWSSNPESDQVAKKSGDSKNKRRSGNGNGKTPRGTETPSLPPISPEKKTPNNQDNPSLSPVLSESQQEEYFFKLLPFYMIEAKTPLGTVSGSGFMVDKRGWLATSHHLIENATSVKVEAIVHDVDDGQLYLATINTEGIIAVKPEHDLAIIKLRASDEVEYTAMKLAVESTPTAKDVLLAMHDPHGDDTWISEYRCKQIVLNTKLPPNSKAVLRRRGMDNASDLRWIHHSGTLGEQDSGAPLINRDGKVVGMNTFLGFNANGGYAIHAKHLAALLNSAKGEVKPFRSNEVAKTDSDDPNPFFSPTSDPKSEPDSEPEPLEVSPDTIEFLAGRCREMEWQPENQEQYSFLHRLAGLLTQTKLILDSDEGTPKQREKLEVATKKVRNELAERRWGKDNQLVSINKMAKAGFENGDDSTFAYAEVFFFLGDRDGPKKVPELDNRYVVLMTLVSTTQYIAVPTNIAPEKMPRGSRWLIMGKRHESINNFQVTVSSPDGQREINAILLSEAIHVAQPKRD